MIKTAISAIAMLATTGVALAQSAPDAATGGLSIPADVTLYGAARDNVYRPSATVNGEIITATDIEQRFALIRIANRGVEIPKDEEATLRRQVFANLIDEKLQIQEARAAKIEIDEAAIDAQFARIAQQYRQTPEAFAKQLASQGSSADSIKQQIRGEYAWDRLLGRDIEPVTNVSNEEVQAMVDRMKQAKGTDEFRVGEIYLSATPENAQAVVNNARRIIEQVQRGGSFAAYARQFSEASTAVVGGDLGWVRAGQLPTSMAEHAATMQPGQIAGPVEVPGGFSIVMMIDRRQYLVADARNATLSLKQIALDFPAGTSREKATALASTFATETGKIAGCGAADAVAARLGAQVVSRDQIAMRDLPAPLQQTLASLQVGQVTQPFGSPDQGVSVLVLCGRDVPQDAGLPSVSDIENQLRTEKVNRRAQRKLRDLRRDAIIEYS